VRELVEGGLAYVGITAAEIVPVVGLSEYSMHYVLLVDGQLLDWGEEWIEPVVGGMPRVIAETLVTAWEGDVYPDALLLAWASEIGYPHAAQLLEELPEHNATSDGLEAWLDEFLGRSV
jgi:hypothetical protein